MNRYFGDEPFVYRVNDNGLGPHLLLQVCIERGWREYTTENGRWNLWWRSPGLALSHYKELNHLQFTNHIPKGSSICRKDNLARHLKRMRKVYGSVFDFSPPCFNLPLEYTKLAAECSRPCRKPEFGKDETTKLPIWICKPVAQSQGKGIYLFRKLSDLSYETSAIVQRYIEKPLLIGGYKFDLRVYVCVPSYHPLTIYVYREGLARFGTDKFSLTDLNNPFRHLTNSSINKMGPGYAEIKDRIGAGCKWTLRQLRKYFQQSGISDWLIWQRIICLITLTVLSHWSLVPRTINCFEVFGFDILVDADLKPWLLEVNLSPALGNDVPADEEVKKPLLHDLFDLLGLPARNNDSKINKKLLVAAGKWRKRSRSRSSSRAGKSRASKPCENDENSISLNATKPRLWETINNNGVSITIKEMCARKNVWGNGTNWKASPNCEGGWTRTFPMFKDGLAFDGGNMKEVVGQMQRYRRQSFDVIKQHPKDTDDEWSARLINELNLTTNIWTPYR